MTELAERPASTTRPVITPPRRRDFSFTSEGHDELERAIHFFFYNAHQLYYLADPDNHHGFQLSDRPHDGWEYGTTKAVIQIANLWRVRLSPEDRRHLAPVKRSAGDPTAFFLAALDLDEDQGGPRHTLLLLPTWL